MHRTRLLLVVAAIGLTDGLAQEQPRKTAVTVTIESVAGDDLTGSLDLEAIRKDIVAIVSQGKELHIGNALQYLMDNLTRERNIRVTGKVVCPDRRINSSFSYLIEDEVNLHTGKWSFQVLKRERPAPGKKK